MISKVIEMFNGIRESQIFLIPLFLGVVFLTGCSSEIVDSPIITHTLTLTLVLEEEGEDIGNTVAPSQSIGDIENMATSEPTVTPIPTETVRVTPILKETEIPTDTQDSQDKTQDNQNMDQDIENAQPSPTPTEAEKENELITKDCFEKAAFFSDITIPDGTFLFQDESFTKTWRFRNEGNCTWTTDYSIVYHSGDIMSAPIEVPLPKRVLPGELVDLSVDMKAPTRGGQQQSNWEFKNSSGLHFGAGSSGKDLFWVIINVRFLDKNDEPQPDPSTLPPPSSPAGCNISRNQDNENQVIALINQTRNQYGLDNLTSNNELSSSALAHSTDMACNDFVGHAGSDGSHWTDRIFVQGYSSSYSTENIYVGFPTFGGTPAGAFEWWMNSQVHRDNILDPKVEDVGVGYVFSENSSYGGYYTINFARP